MENHTQQQPQVVNPEEIFSKVFGTQKEGESQEPAQALPIPPVSQEIPPIVPLVAETPKAEEEPTAVISDYSNKIKNFIEAGLIEDCSITIDGEDVYLSDVDIKDEETYKTLLEQIKTEKDNQFKEKYISKDGLDETFLKIVETRKAGGNVNEIIKENVQAIDQLQMLKTTFEEGEDKEKEQLAINIVAQDLRQRGLTDRVVQAQLQDYVENGLIEEEASKILDTHLGLHTQAIEEKKNKELERMAQEKEESKNFKKTLSSTYKNLGVPEHISKILLENATKVDEYQITNSDKLYFDAKQDPEFFAELNYFLNNPKEFKKWVSSKSVLETKKDVIKSSITINTSKTRPTRPMNNNNIDDLAEQAFNK